MTLQWSKMTPQNRQPIFLQKIRKYAGSEILTLKWSKMTPQNSQNEPILTENFDFRDHLSTLGAENPPTNSGPFKVKKNAQTHPKQL